VKESIKKQILDGCRFLYASGPYTRLVVFDTPIRGFHYFFGGGTTVNPTKYANGDLTVASMTERGYIPNARQAIATVLPPFGKAYQLSGDPFYKDAANEMYDSAYGGSDGYRAYFDGDAKSYNQHARRVGSLLAWLGGVTVPLPTPTPQPPQPIPVPPTEPIPPPPTSPTPSPNGTKSTSITDSEGGVWTLGTNKETLRNGLQMGGGQGTIYKYVESIVYVLGMDSNWWKWNPANSFWSSVGAAEPGTVAPTPPPPTPIPEPLPPLPPALPRVLLYPTSLAGQVLLWQTQAKDGYRPNRVVPRPANQPKGNYVEFVKW
jgi:hypothetical protein